LDPSFGDSLGRERQRERQRERERKRERKRERERERERDAFVIFVVSSLVLSVFVPRVAGADDVQSTSPAG
jgi:hypothetical protein